MAARIACAEFWRWDNALRPREHHRGLKRRKLLHCHGLDHASVVKSAETGRHAVVPQATGMDGRRNKPVPQGMHLHYGRHAGTVTVVKRVYAPRQRGRRRGLDSQQAGLSSIRQVLPQERIRNATKIGAAARRTQ